MCVIKCEIKTLTTEAWQMNKSSQSTARKKGELQMCRTFIRFCLGQIIEKLTVSIRKSKMWLQTQDNEQTPKTKQKKNLNIFNWN